MNDKTITKNFDFVNLLKLAVYILIANFVCYFLIYIFKVDVFQYSSYLDSIIFSLGNILVILGFYFANLNLSVKEILTNFSLSKKSLLITVAMLVVTVIFSSILNMLTATTAKVSTMPRIYQDFSANYSIFYGILAIFFAAIKEELIFRYALFDFSKRYMNALFSVIFTALVFTFMHVGYDLSFLYVINYLMLGAFLGWLRVSTKSLLPCIFVHFVVNVLAFL